MGSSGHLAGEGDGGKPRGRNFFTRAARRMTTWSSRAFRAVRAPESRTRSFTPAAVSLVVSSASSSRLPGLDRQRRGRSLWPARPWRPHWPWWRHRAGLPVGDDLGPRAQDLGVLAHQHHALAVEPLLHLLHQSLEFGRVSRLALDRHQVGLELQAHPLVFQFVELFQAGVDLAVAHLVGDQNGDPVGLTNRFSWRNMTVSPPIFRAWSPAPMVRGRMGGAEASASSALACSETYGTGRELGLAGRQLHGKGQAGGHAAFSAVRLGKIFENLNSGQGHLCAPFRKMFRSGIAPTGSSMPLHDL